MLIVTNNLRNTKRDMSTLGFIEVISIIEHAAVFQFFNSNNVMLKYRFSVYWFLRRHNKTCPLLKSEGYA
jgi:hypothetical protein